MKKNASQKIRYAVVGLGYISQAAVLPAFRHAARNSELAALVSDDPVKLRQLGKKYSVSRLYSYADYEDCLRSGEVDAVYLALPNNLHCEYSVRAAEAGIHVLCEKPMATTVEECRKMIAAAEGGRVKLMVAYRLFFERAYLKAVATARSGKLGDLRIFNSLFGMQVKVGNSRLQKKLGGGTLYDLGIYCINAARNLFGCEPMEVFAISANNGEKRFREVDEMTGAVLRFPGERLATFVSSFGSADVSAFEIVGAKKSLIVEKAYEMVEGKTHKLKRELKEHSTRFPKGDQFSPELSYFSECIQKNRDPEPGGAEGLADVRVIEALYFSAQSGKSVSLQPLEKESEPDPDLARHRPPVAKPKLVHAQAPGA
ncbi:MAG: Gfo/Idh/MocA family oxidoreductase [Deltaproteobacteria bacterium]|nr:Gfo/Idh/MocA family oxidoreductase [Deltaproteobacteria bacterium]